MKACLPFFIDPFKFHENENELPTLYNTALFALLFTFIIYLYAFYVLVCQADATQLIIPITNVAIMNKAVGC